MPLSKPSRARAWTWFDPLYRLNYVLLSATDAPGCRRAVRRIGIAGPLVELLEQAQLFDCTSNGRFVMVPCPPCGHLFGILLNPEAAYATIAHEAFHAVYAMAESRGLHLSGASEEAFAYYLEYLVREIDARMSGRHRGP